MDQIAEKYQLKWHSFGTYLHQCIASSLQNELFTDVALVTLDGFQIMAHRFVLSACSQYLHQVLKHQPRMTTALPLMIILPPEINYKTMKTLIQYMYSGEATVSKDILESVLRGGDLLKIKGLWRPKEDENRENKLVKVSHKNENVQSKNRNKNLNETKKTQNETTDIENDQNLKQVQNTVIKRTDDERRKESKSSESQCSDNTDITNSSSPQFLLIKEEPLEWNEMNEEQMEEVVESEDMYNADMTIKPEICMEESEDPSELYSPLTCELCTETFTLPAEWVRHVQTHTDMLPAKRQRRGKNVPEEETDEPFPPLPCDLCQKFFSTPADWVHHIQNTHTEFELHLSNKSAPNRKVVRQSRVFGPIYNSCSICCKKFPSHASLLIHKRTHTGEKPYMCELCCKGFNVKSNLLRHLRTVHDKIINPTEVDDGRDENTGD